jgi:hypothetical protein
MSEEVKPLKAQSATESSTPPLEAGSPTDLVKAAYEFLLNLRQILAADRPPEINEALAEQRRIIQLLKALSIFIDQAWIEPKAEVWRSTRYLFDLAAGIDQLQEGVAHPIFMTTKRTGAPLDRQDVWHARKWVCLALECFAYNGQSAADGAKDIAGRHPILKRLIRHANEDTVMRNVSKTSLANAIISWHRQFQQGLANAMAQDSWFSTFLPMIELANRKRSDKMEELGHQFLKLACDGAKAGALKPSRDQSK